MRVDDGFPIMEEAPTMEERRELIFDLAGADTEEVDFGSGTIADPEAVDTLSVTLSFCAAGGGRAAAGVADMGLIRGAMARIVTLGVVSCGLEGAFVTLFLRAAARIIFFFSWAAADSMDMRLSRGCGVGVWLGHDGVDDVKLSARGPRGMGEAVGLTVGFTMRYSFLSCSA